MVMWVGRVLSMFKRDSVLQYVRMDYVSDVIIFVNVVLISSNSS